MIKERFRWLNENVFLKALAVLVGGSAIAQVINFVFQPIITRLYTPADFGIYGLFISTVSILLITATLAYEQSIAASKDPDEAQSLMFGTIYISAILSVAMFVMILILYNQIIDVFRLGKAQWLYFLPLNVFTTNLYAVVTSYNYRLGKHKDLATSAVRRVVALNGFQILLYYLGLGYLGLVIGQTIGLVFGISKLARNILEGNISFSNAKREIVIQTLKNNKQYPAYLLPASFVDRLKKESITYIIFYLYSPLQLGLYALTERLLSLPMSLISDSIRKLLIVRLAGDDYDPRLTRKFYLRLSLTMFIGISLPFLVLYFYGGEIISLVFGSQWYAAGGYVRAMCLVYITNFIVYPLSGIAIVLNKQRGILVFQTGLGAAVLVSAVSAKLLGLNIEQYLLTQSTIMATLYLVMWVYCYRLIR